MKIVDAVETMEAGLGNILQQISQQKEKKTAEQKYTHSLREQPGQSSLNEFGVKGTKYVEK